MAELLKVENLTAGYGAADVLHAVSFSIREAQSLALLGRNGAGKTTLILALIGAARASGVITFAGRDLSRLPSEQRALAGMGWVPQERNVFRSLTVDENMTAVARPGPWGAARVYQLFPRLAERKKNLGSQLSGGEQQMLAIGRALATNPKLLLLDEPLEGLAPIIVEELLAALRKITREEGLAALIVEQHARRILAMTDQALVLERGAVALAGASAEILKSAASLDRLLGVSGKAA